MDWRMNAPKDGMPAENTYSVEAVRALDTHRTPIQKQPKMLLCLVGISRSYYLRDEVYPTFLHDDDRDMDMFNLIRAPNPTKVKIGSRPCAAHEVPLLTLTANQVVEIEDPAVATDSPGVPSTIERSPLDFANEAGCNGYHFHHIHDHRKSKIEKEMKMMKNFREKITKTKTLLKLEREKLHNNKEDQPLHLV
nr:transposase (putative), gypsy type [Tanacetum cinerariifolium]